MKFIEIIIAIIGFIFLFIPDDFVLKIIVALTTTIIISFVHIYHIRNENKKINKKNNELKEENNKLNKFYEEHIASKTEYNKSLDSKILKEIKDTLYKSGVMYLMKNHDFNSTYERDLVDPLINYHEKYRNDPEFKFMDPELNDLKLKLNDNVAGLLQTLGKYSQPLDVNPNFSSIPKDWEFKNPELFQKAVSASNGYADEITKIYEKLISLAREKQLTL